MNKQITAKTIKLKTAKYSYGHIKMSEKLNLKHIKGKILRTFANQLGLVVANDKFSY